MNHLSIAVDGLEKINDLTKDFSVQLAKPAVANCLILKIGAIASSTLRQLERETDKVYSEKQLEALNQSTKGIL